ncbi:quinohemoprotein amine dehydrogenase subunit alpha [Neptuniibacter halophilus]|uniref:quinohemoprotein amine dehydrogenase subunit alpha n=1 Tax=Neptuniibacter halophilus TaxID=651666 RepID=UPI002572885B|nr:quinohemoprotein amine dehydrogenase subunit alpha [Neptuniibacter halophilus]
MKRVLRFGGAVAFLGFASAASAIDGPQIIKENCLLCHSETGQAEAPFTRISQQRKTPEGWQMTINRMKSQRGLHISPEHERVLIKYLADNQGLAPSETAGLRYVLEREPNVVEQDVPEHVAGTCTGCHSSARSGLQRRTQDEWEKLVHFHMGQVPSIEFLAGHRDRPWFQIAVDETSVKLGEGYPFKSKAWDDWKAAPKADLKGDWAMSGFMPDKGEFTATMSVMPSQKDEYVVLINGHYADGSKLSGSGSAKVFTGYEWRAAVVIDGRNVRQVFAASEDGKQLSGRAYLKNDDVMGGSVTAVKADKAATLVSVSPASVKQGATQTLVIAGANLSDKVSLGAGVKVEKVLSQSADRLVVQVKAAANAAMGQRDLKVGDQTLAGAVAVYDSVARVEITPSESIARIGGNGGPIPKQKAIYRAVGYAAGADGKAGTEDDLSLGYLPASWTLKAFDEMAEHDNDLKYAGSIDAKGIFTPGDAGLNPERKMSTNNVGNLAVVGTVKDGADAVSGQAHLMVTVQDFVKELIQ